MSLTLLCLSTLFATLVGSLVGGLKSGIPGSRICEFVRLQEHYGHHPGSCTLVTCMPGWIHSWSRAVLQGYSEKSLAASTPDRSGHECERLRERLTLHLNTPNRSSQASGKELYKMFNLTAFAICSLKRESFKTMDLRWQSGSSSRQHLW